MKRKLGSILLALSMIAASGCSADTSTALTQGKGAEIEQPESISSEDAEASAADSSEGKIPIINTSTVIQLSGPKKTKPASSNTREKTDTSEKTDEVGPENGELPVEPDVTPPDEVEKDLPEDEPVQDDAPAGDLLGEKPAPDDSPAEGSPVDGPDNEELPQSGPGEEEEEISGGEDSQTEGESIRSNLPPELKAELDRDHNGILLIFHPDRYEKIKSITKWTVVEYGTGTQLLLVTKKRGSIVEVTRAALTEGQKAIPGEVIRSWETTSDYEVIRILYTDLETMPLNFIRVRQPDGKATVRALQRNAGSDSGWLAVEYDRNDQ